MAVVNLVKSLSNYSRAKRFKTLMSKTVDDIKAASLDIAAGGLYIGSSQVANFSAATITAALAGTVATYIVDEVALAPTGNEAGNDGWTVLVNGTGTGDFDTQDNVIATWDDTAEEWSFSAEITLGVSVFSKRSNVIYSYEGSGEWNDTTSLPLAVDEVATAPTGNEVGTDGFRVLIDGTGTGVFASHNNEIAVWDDDLEIWVFHAVPAGADVYSIDDDILLVKTFAGGWSTYVTAHDLATHTKSVGIQHPGTGTDDDMDVFLCVAERDFDAIRASIVVKTTLPDEVAVYWQISIHNLTADVALSSAATKNNGAAITQNIRYAVLVDQNTSISQDDVLVVRWVKNSGPAANIPAFAVTLEQEFLVA